MNVVCGLLFSLHMLLNKHTHWAFKLKRKKKVCEPVGRVVPPPPCFPPSLFPPAVQRWHRRPHWPWFIGIRIHMTAINLHPLATSLALSFSLSVDILHSCTITLNIPAFFSSSFGPSALPLSPISACLVALSSPLLISPYRSAGQVPHLAPRFHLTVAGILCC